MSDAVALAIKVTSDASDATAGLDETSDKLDSVSDSAKGAASVAGQTARGLGGLAKGFDLIGADGAADSLKEVQQALGFVKGATGLTSLATSAYTAVTGGSTVATIAKSVAEKAAAVGTAVMTAAQWALNAALTANPVLLIVVGIIALAAALVLAYKKSETFRAIVNAAFAGIMKVVSVVIDFIRDHWKALLIILTGPVGIAVALIATHLDKVKAVVGAIVDWVQEHWPAIKAILVGAFSEARDKIGPIISAIQTAIETAKSGIETAIGAIKTAVQAVVDTFQAVLDKIQAVIDLAKKIPHIDIPLVGGRVAAGAGSVTGASTSLAGLGSAALHNMAGERHIHLHMPGVGFIGNNLDLGRALSDALDEHDRRFGR